jgi:DNA-binding Lrp family transcriptional regulator
MDDVTSEGLDRIDRQLLAALQDDARLTTAELAQRVALSASPCWRRVKRLESQGFVRGYHAALDAERLGWGVTAFVQVTLERHELALGEHFEAAVRDVPEIVACHNVSGAYDYLLQVLARDLKSFGELSRTVIRSLPGVKEMNSSFSLREVKRGAGVPMRNG